MTEKPKRPAWSEQTYWQKRFDEADTPWELMGPSSVVIEALEYIATLGCRLGGARVLVAGCGSGSDALECARRGARVLAIDWSEAAIAQVSRAYEANKGAIPGVVKVIQGDFFSIPPEPVDVVCEHTFFCAIDPFMRLRYMESMAKWLKPGGYLCGNFFVLPSQEVAHLKSLSLTREGQGPPFVTGERDLIELCSPWFEVVRLQPAASPEPSRRPGLEWVGVLRRVDKLLI